MPNSMEPVSFKLPTHELEVLSFSAPQPKKVQEWVDSLPKMNVGESAKQLYAAIQELNRLKTDAATRFQLMEIMRGPIHFICISLEKHFLNKSVVLPERESRIAKLTQALQNHLVTGYKAVVTQALMKMSSKENKRLCQLAIHRAMSDKNLVLLRSFQLYFPAPVNFWKEIHLLYLISQRFGFSENTIEDPQEDDWKSSILDLYKCSMLLATAKPNQLRQNQIKLVYDAAKFWAGFAEITQEKTVAGLFSIDVTSDIPPIYQSLMRKGADPKNIRYFDASAISDQLRVLLQIAQGESHPVTAFHVPEKLSVDLTRILIQAWGVLAERAFTRIEEYGLINLSIGLSATHYFLSGKMEFSRLLAGEVAILTSDQKRPFEAEGEHGRRQDLYDSTDVWGRYDTDDAWSIKSNQERLSSGIENRIASQDVQKQEEKDRYPVFQCDIVNTSPGGFCVIWQQDVPPQVKTGEIIGVEEKQSGHWTIGVIRWVKQFKDEGVRMGLELIAPKGEACAAQVIQKKGGETEYMRALMLPELTAIGQPATIITPNIAFSVGNKININEIGDVSKGQLVKQITSTASFCQFQFKLLTLAPGKAARLEAERQQVRSESNHSNDDDDFDSIWSSL